MTEQLIGAVTRAGGFCGRPALRSVATDHQIAQAVREGTILRLRRGHYALPAGEEHRERAHRMSATLSDLSAAMHWEWPVKTLPGRPTVTVGRHRTVTELDQRETEVHWRALSEDDVIEGVTSPLRTALDCMASLPFDEGLAVADSALRSGLVRPIELTDGASELRGRGATAARRVAAAADRRAANPFESVLRAIALEFTAYRFTPQLTIDATGMWVSVDLGDPGAKVVLEADSFEFHGARQGLVRDCARYDELTVRGWTVLRFTWEHVMLHPDYVRWCLANLAAGQLGVEVPAAPRLC